jgi:biopolymer transport protein ExbD
MVDEQKPDNRNAPDEEFGLTAPGEFKRQLRVPPSYPAPGQPIEAKSSRPPVYSDSEILAGGWKGFQEELDDPDPNVDFTRGKKLHEDELDMTPMVDVTFLLLIFFMVTASFTIRKSFEQAHANVDDPSQNVVDPVEDVDDFVEVIIDQTNTYYIRTRDTEEIEAPSDHEMRDVLRTAKEDAGATRLIVRAHVDALHGKVIKVLDFANAVGIERVETVVSEVDF